LLVVAALTSLMLASAGARLAQRHRDPLLDWAAAGVSATVTGRLSTDPVPMAARFPGTPPRYLVRLAVRSVVARSASRTGPGQVVVMGGAQWSGLAAGQVVQARGKLASSRPGEAAAARLTARTGPVVISPGSWPWRVADRLRVGLRAACAGLGADSRGLLPALVVGDTSHLPEQLRADLRTSGLTHLTAVSGANLVIVATAVSTMLALAGARIRVRVLGAALAIIGFVVLARPEPSVLRAAVMACFGLIALLSARPARGVPLLSGTVLVLLLADPWLSRSYGFALSVLATAGLLLLVPAWLRRLAGMGQTPGPDAGRGIAVQPWLALACAPVAVPVAALVCTAPVTVLLQPQLPAVSIPANLLAEPAVAIATLLGVLAALLSPWWPWAASMAAHAGGLATGWIAEVAHRGAKVPGASVPWWPGRPGALVLAAVLVVILVVSLWHSPAQPRAAPRPDTISRRLREAAVRAGSGQQGLTPVALVLCAGLVIAGLGLIAGVRGLIPLPGGPAGGVPRDWVVIQCDVGQGSATLLRTGQGRAMLADTGPDPGLAADCLRRNHIVALDLVVITHFHADHAGGLPGVLPQFGRPPVLVSPLARPASQSREVHSAAGAAGSAVVVGTAGMSGAIGTQEGALTWRVVYPGEELAGTLQMSGRGSSTSDDEGTQINDASLALVITVKGVRIAILGDLETDAQRALLMSLGPIDPVDVVVVAHHGSARQYPPLYAALAPRVALIGVGAGNDYGHPAPSALALLARRGVSVLRTDTQGQLAIAGTPQSLRASTAR
jgi:competence protein ComEC